MSTEMIQKAVADYFAATRAMDAQAWVETFAEDGTSYDPAAPPATLDGKGQAAGGYVGEAKRRDGVQ